MLGTLDLNLPFFGGYKMVEKRRWSQCTPQFFSSWPRSHFYPFFTVSRLTTSPSTSPFWAGTPTGCRDGTSDERAEMIPSCWNRAVDRCCPQVKRDLKREICGDVVNFPESMGISVDLTMFAYWCFFGKWCSAKKQTNGVRYTTHSKTDLGDSFDESENKSI